MRSVFYWEAAGLSLTRANPYGGLLARALADEGVELVAGHAADLTADWLRENQGQVQVLHLNWPHYMYDGTDLAARVERAARLVGNLALARELGYQLVWTVHNLYPHESAHRDLDHLLRVAITHLATAVIAHCHHARGLVERHFHRRDGLFVIPHGNFIDAYPNTISRSEARQQLGIGPDQFVYLFFGNVRPYKGLEQLLSTFTQLEGDHLTLLLAAKVYNAYGDAFVAQARSADRRVIVSPSRFFANEELQLYFNAADVAVLPFLDVLTSGSTITALSFGVPVIVPAVGCLPELADQTTGIVYDPHPANALATAMQAMLGKDMAACRQAAAQRAQELAWPAIARQTVAAYRYPHQR